MTRVASIGNDPGCSFCTWQMRLIQSTRNCWNCQHFIHILVPYWSELVRFQALEAVSVQCGSRKVFIRRDFGFRFCRFTRYMKGTGSGGPCVMHPG